MVSGYIAVLGAYLTDLACRTDSMPAWGETVRGRSFSSGPGGKGSNQVIAAARAGATSRLMSRIGSDGFGRDAMAVLQREGVGTQYVSTDTDLPTGTASIIVDEKSGENAIIIVPSACDAIVHEKPGVIDEFVAGAVVFLSQLELPLEICVAGIDAAVAAGVPTVLNPAPGIVLSDDIFPKLDYITPNQSEAHALVGFEVKDLNDAERAACELRDRGVGNVLITLGRDGVFVNSDEFTGHVSAFEPDTVIDTTGAGDAFNGGFAAGLSENMSLERATRFGCATAALSVTRLGTAPSMPNREEIDHLLACENGHE